MCFIEWPVKSANGRVDYAFFGEGYVESIAAEAVAPIMLVEAKAKHVNLGRHVSRLEGYVKGVQEAGDGVAVLTNGKVWWIYQVEWGRPIDRSNREVIDVVNGSPWEIARRLEARMSPDNWFGG